MGPKTAAGRRPNVVLALEKQPHKTLALFSVKMHIGERHMCSCYSHFFFFGHMSSCSHLCPKRCGGWAQFDRSGHVAGGLGAIRAVRRAWQALPTFLALDMDKANPRVSATSSIVCAYKGHTFFMVLDYTLCVPTRPKGNINIRSVFRPLS